MLSLYNETNELLIYLNQKKIIMAHNLNFNEETGKFSFFSVNKKAWHNLGQIVDKYPTSKEAIIHAGLDYKVEKRNLFANNDLQTPVISIPNYSATVRTDTQQILGVVGKDYEIVQNVEAFEFFDQIVGGDGIFYETAGALGNGERIFITAKLPDYIKVGNKDLIEQYLFLTTSHDGFGSITAAFTPIRIVCNNTLNAALRDHSNAIKIRHTVNANDRLKQAHKLMGISQNFSEELNTIFNKWAKVQITDKELLKLIQVAMAPNKETLLNLETNNLDYISTNYKNVVEKVYAYAMGAESQNMETTAGTVFGAYNAVTGYFQNVRTYKDDESKFKSILEGTAKNKAQTAFNLCMDFSKVGANALNLN